MVKVVVLFNTLEYWIEATLKKSQPNVFKGIEVIIKCPLTPQQAQRFYKCDSNAFCKLIQESLVLSFIKSQRMGTDTQADMLQGLTLQRHMRSKIRWFTEFCNSHYVSQFAAFFIDARAQRSTVKSCRILLFFFLFSTQYKSLIFFKIVEMQRGKKRKKFNGKKDTLLHNHLFFFLYLTPNELGGKINKKVSIGWERKSGVQRVYILSQKREDI